jgi:hypothetical protein
MNTNEFNAKGIKITIIKKSEFEMVGYTKPANLGDGSISLFVKDLVENGQMDKLSTTLKSQQQIWVCLSDVSCSKNNTICPICDMSCSGFQVRCIVCVEKTENHDFSEFKDNELFTLHLPASEWALFELNDSQSAENLHKFGVYELVKETGYKWNESIRLHFDNEHECYNNGEWNPDKNYYFLLLVISNIN